MALPEVLRDMMLESDRILQEQFSAGNAAGKELWDQWKSPGFYQEADRNGEKKCGVVRVDHLLTALHLARARITFRTMPDFWQRALLNVVTNVQRMLNRLALNAVAKTVPGARIINEFLTAQMQFMELSVLQRNLEKEIRSSVGGVRKELNAIMLKQARDRRPVGDVHTRHFREKKTRRMKGCSSR